jgi:hypothetical protein
MRWPGVVRGVADTFAVQRRDRSAAIVVFKQKTGF